jgi:hypothetical protein
MISKLKIEAELMKMPGNFIYFRDFGLKHAKNKMTDFKTNNRS